MEDLVAAASPDAKVDPAFWSGKRVLLTGHTGFKGSWAALWLSSMGARVSGFALPPEPGESLHGLLDLSGAIDEHIGDIRDPDRIAQVVEQTGPEIVLHLAAQAQVHAALADPRATFDTNVMGTANLLEAMCLHCTSATALIATTDKVYANDETGRPFREEDRLGGHDPYTASKAAAEMVVASYAACALDRSSIVAATARGGNVIGGGDFAANRIVPNIWRAARAGEPLLLRCPEATRPWQHVLDCLAGYLLYAQALAGRAALPRSLNFGPASGEGMAVHVLAETLQAALGVPAGWVADDAPWGREMTRLGIDSTRARQALGWRDRLSGQMAIDYTAAWYGAYAAGADMRSVSMDQIRTSFA